MAQRQDGVSGSGASTYDGPLDIEGSPYLCGSVVKGVTERPDSRTDTDSPTARSLGQSQSVVGTIPNSALASTKNGVPAAMIWRGSFRGAKWLTYRLDVNDISSNSWSNDPCSEKEESRRRMQDVSG